MIEIYQLPEGKIMISHCDQRYSVGLLELDAYQSLAKHNRPVAEELLQIVGTSTMKLFNKGQVQEITLRKGERIVIPPNQYHIHANSASNRSITLWQFSGDIRTVIEDIRRKYQTVN